jgi:endo-1,4-beta-xylanase
MSNFSLMSLLLAGTVLMASVCRADYVRPEGPTLKELARNRGIHFGANFPHLVYGKSPNNWQHSPIVATEKAIAEEQFTTMTAGWAMFPGHSWTGPGEYRFRGADRAVEWCRRRGIHLHGHGLGYARRVEWFTELPAETEEQRAKIRTIYENYVRDTAGHFRGKTDLWDVCNEQLDYWYGRSSYLTDFNYWKAYQTDPGDPESGFRFFTRTFELARREAPEAELIYLDFNNEIICPKSNRMLELVTRLRREGAPIDGAGWQMHLDTNWRRDKHGIEDADAYFDNVRQNWRRFADLDLNLWITELSVAIDPEADLKQELERQADLYRRVVEAALEFENLRGIKMWGIMDASPWGLREERPYVFDGDGRAKPAFYAVQETLAHYRPRTVARDDFSGNDEGAWRDERSFPRSDAQNTRVTDYADSEPALVLSGDGAAAERTLDLTGLRKARLWFEHHAGGLLTDTDARLAVEAATPGGDWRRLKRCDAGTAGKRSPLEGPWLAVCTTLPADLRGDTVRLRFRLLDAKPDTTCGIDDVRVIADSVDD